MSQTAQGASPVALSSAGRGGQRLAVVYLVVTFASGLVLAYGTGLGRADPPGGQPDPAEAAARPASAPRPESLDDSPFAKRVAALEVETAHLTAKIGAVDVRVQALEHAMQKGVGSALEPASARPGGESEPPPRGEEAGRGALQTLDTLLVSLGAEPTSEGMRLTVGESELQFEPGRAGLSADPSPSLGQLADVLADYPRLDILLRGHTDSTGGAQANLTLSERRALAVRDLLLGLGVEARRMRVEGVGEAEPVADNAAAEGRRRNRRVEIVLIQP